MSELWPQMHRGEGRVALVEENCRHCGGPSKEMHPGGVISGLWRCYRCMRWQQEDPEEAAYNDLIEDAVFNQVEDI